MASLKAETDLTQLEDYLNRLRTMRVESFHRKIEGLLRRSILDHQKAQEGIDGPYRELSPAYAEWKDEHYPGAEILWAEGDMIASFTTEAGPKELIGYFEDAKASFHMGDGPFNQPNYRRDPLFLDSEFIDKITDIAADHFSNAEESGAEA